MKMLNRFKITLTSVVFLFKVQSASAQLSSFSPAPGFERGTRRTFSDTSRFASTQSKYFSYTDIYKEGIGYTTYGKGLDDYDDLSIKFRNTHLDGYNVYSLGVKYFFRDIKIYHNAL